MSDPYADLLIRIYSLDDDSGAYPVEASLDDGSFFGEGALRLDLRALLAAQVDAEAYGRMLFDALFSGPVRDAYNQATGRAQELTDGRLRVRLWIDNSAAELHALPWERLYHILGGQFVPLSISWRTPFSRYTGLRRPEPEPVAVRPIRLLFAIANPSDLPEGFAPIAVEEELKALQQGLGDLWGSDQFWITILPGRTELSPNLRRQLNGGNIQIRDGATSLDNILRHLPGQHVFHFLGHGFFRRERQHGEGTAALYLEQEDGTLDIVQDGELVPRLAALHPLPHLVFLVACETARREVMAEHPFVGLGPKLVKAGVPAVVAMQEQLPMDVARQLTGDYYRRLLEHGIVDKAMNEARTLLFERVGVDWAIPVLFMRLVEGQLFLAQKPLPQAPRVPYKGLASYTRQDADLFKGRSELIERVYHHIREQPVTVVYGEAGVGLSSLLEAGVRPRLEGDGDLVVTISEYEDLATEIRARMRVDGRPLWLQMRSDAPLPDILQAVGTHRFNHVVLVLDQFERVLDLPSEARAEAVSALTASLKTLGARLRLVFAVHSDHLGDLAALQEHLEGLAQPWVPVSVLDGDTAAAAIIEPLRDLGWPVHLDPKLAREQIIGDLDDLYEPEEPAQTRPEGSEHQKAVTIDPGHLQIVCSCLYELARHRESPYIDEQLYAREAGGAEGILATYMKETLATHLADEQQLAQQILVGMAAPESALRVTAEALKIADVPLDRVEGVLERLADAEFLVRRPRGGQAAYAFANTKVAQEARRLGGEDLERRYRAGDELERAWRMWLAAVVEPGAGAEAGDRALPSAPQLRYLAGSGTHLRPKPQKALLALRAAIVHGDLAMGPWLAWIRTAKGRELVETLDRPGQAPGKAEERYAELDKARRLLGMYDLAPDDEAGSSKKEVISVTRTALYHRNPVSRRTAALALMALPPCPDEALQRLEAALGQEGSPLWRWRRKAELWGTLFDAEGGKGPSSGLSPPERSGIWLWRMWRRLVFYRDPALALALGGAVGAALGLALLRGATARAAGLMPGLAFGVGIWWGLLLGVALVAGLLLSEILALERRETGEKPAAARHIQLRPGGKAVILGALGFGFAHFLVAGAVGYSSLGALGLLTVAALLMGLGISLGFYGRSWSENRTEAWRWPIRLLPVVAGALLGQMTIYLAGREWSTAVGIPGTNYRSQLSGIEWPWWQNLITQYPAWYRAIGLLDAALMAVVLYLGLAAGLWLAARWLPKPE